MSVADDNLKPRTLRSKLTNAFVEALQRKWETCGDEVIEEIRKDNPALLARLVADLCPKEAHVAVEAGGAYADCQSTSELVERLLTENGAAIVTARMRERALAELSRHTEALDAIARGRKTQQRLAEIAAAEDPTNKRERLMREKRKPLAKLSLPWTPPN